MEKYLVSIEFRYNDVSKDKESTDYKNKKLTVGVFDTQDEAINEGNKALEVFESKFKLHKFPKGNEAKKERFSKNGGCFGSANNLVTNMAYLQTPFEFFAKITKLNYFDLEDSISEVVEATKRYRTFKIAKKEN